MASFTIRPNGQGTRGTWTAQGGGTTNLHQSIDDYLAGGAKDDDTTYVEGPNLADSTMFVLLEDTPSDFDPANITSISIKSAYRKNEAGVSGSADTVALFYQLFRSDETTAITTELSKGNITSTSYAEATDGLTGTGTHTKTDWDGACLRIRQDYTQAGCADTTARLRVTAVEITVEYSAAVSAAPGTGAGTWAGIVPTLAFGIAVATGAASWTGFAPTVEVTNHVAVAPATGEASWTGFAPTVSVGAGDPDVLLRTGSDATIVSTLYNERAFPAVGAGAWAGVAPTIAISDHQSVSPGTGSGVWAGIAPTVDLTVSAEPGTGAGAWTGFAPTVSTSADVSAAPGTGAGGWAGFAPTLAISDHETAAPDVGAGTWAGFAPAVQISNHIAVAPATGAGVWAGTAPSVAVSDHQVVTPETGAGVWTGFAPGVFAGAGASPGTGSGLWAGHAPTVDLTQHVSVEPATGAAVWVGFAPTVAVGSGGVVVSPETGIGVWTGYAPHVVTEVPVPVPVLGTPYVSGTFSGVPGATDEAVAQPSASDITLRSSGITIEE